MAINKWTISCTDSSGTASTSGGVVASVTAAAADTETLSPLPATADGRCSVTAPVSLPMLGTTGFTPSNFSAELDYAPASPTPTPTATATPTSPGPAPVHPIKGFGGKCVDDKGNSSSNRAAIVIWGCSGSDPAENWKFSGGEFIHNGKCMNDKGNGGSGSKVILYSCNGGANEKWAQLANGELKLQAHGGTLCLDDPRSSTANGTQLIVFACKNSANQHWSLP